MLVPFLDSLLLANQMPLGAQCTQVSVRVQPYILFATAGSVLLTIFAYGFIPFIVGKIGSPKAITYLRKVRNALGRIGIIVLIIGGIYLLTIWSIYPDCF